MGEMIEGQYSNYVLQKIMDTAPPAVAQDLMLVLRYMEYIAYSQLAVAQDLMLVFRYMEYIAYTQPAVGLSLIHIY